jgi:hypothetical protein
VTRGTDGEPGIAHGLLEQCSQRVPELVGVNIGMPSCCYANWRHTCCAPAMVNRLKLAALFARANEQSGGVVHGCRGSPRPRPGPCLGHFDDALTVAFTEHPPALRFPLAAVEPEDFGAARTGGQQQQDQCPVAFLHHGVGKPKSRNTRSISGVLAGSCAGTECSRAAYAC